MLYCFKTFRTSYYFPDRAKDYKFLYSIYHPFGGKLSRIYWWLFQHSYIIRWVNRVPNPETKFPYMKIISLCPKGSVVSFNMGTPGAEQKISMLGLNPDGTRFFAKYSTKPKTLEMSKNEIKVLSALKETGLTPFLFDYKIESDYVFFRTSCVDGEPLKNVSISEKITNLAIKLSKFHLADKVENSDLKYCLSHGDFTPWNVMTVKGKYQLIDWELADERPLGYDLFLYISHFNDSEHLLAAYKNEKKHIDKYFLTHGIEDWIPYLHSFARLKIQYEKDKGETERAKFYKQILNFKI